MKPLDRLQALNLSLPRLAKPGGNYVHAVRTGNLLFIAGKGPAEAIGKVGAEISVEQAYECAKEVGLQLLAVMQDELGALSRVTRVVKVVGLINATPEFTEHSKVIDGCSDLMVAVFGEIGRHARTSVGVASLPRGIPVEIEAVIQIGESI